LFWWAPQQYQIVSREARLFCGFISLIQILAYAFARGSTDKINRRRGMTATPVYGVDED
jgi:hypothetical protein